MQDVVKTREPVAPVQVGKPPAPARRRPGHRRASIAGYLFILPFIGAFVTFRLIPGLSSFILTFFDYRLSGTFTYIGTHNYHRLVGDPVFWHALRVTLEFSAIQVPLVVAVALAMAVLLNRPLAGIPIFRAIYFLPVVTSLVLSGIVWQWLYALDGPLNGFLKTVFGAGPVPWIQSTGLVVPSVAVMATWNRFGFGMLILLAGLQAVPSEILEAASVDGASSWSRFWRITLPQLKPQLFFVILIETIYSFQAFDAIYVMTGGGPARGSYTLVYMLYEQGFRFFHTAYGSTIGVVLFLLTFFIAMILRRLLGRDEA